MSVHLLTDTDSGATALYCSTTDWAFGPVFEAREEAEAFLRWLRPLDPRSMSEANLHARFSDFVPMIRATGKSSLLAAVREAGRHGLRDRASRELIRENWVSSHRRRVPACNT